MAIIKCKMCGGDLRIIDDSSVCECEYCGTRQTVPKADDEKKMTLFTRAARLLRNCEFDKASGVFETVVADFPEEAEAYWGLVLCKYGIEYVDDPATGKKVPTCHRSSFESVLDDPNFEQACEYADAIARRVYRDEARQIETLRKGIIEVSGKEDPYDIFISYKETDENNERTLDSVIAQDIYNELTEKGYRVFFSRISLESKLGTEYEPYIFAALNSAKVMLVVGTDYENFDAVWVKNEWSRFLKLIASGQKKTLIPVFKNMDAYDMPKEFSKLAAQDMGKVGAMQDLLRGIEKLIPRKKAEPIQTVTPAAPRETVIVQQSSEGTMKTDSAIKRGNMALEDGEWAKAKEYFDQALTLDAESAQAYFGMFLADMKAKSLESFIQQVCGRSPESEKLTIARDDEHIRDMVRQYTIDGFNTGVEGYYNYDLSYSSNVKGQQVLNNQILQQVNSNRNLNRALQFANEEEKARVTAFREHLERKLREKADIARKQDEEKVTKLKAAYAAFLKDTDSRVIRQHKDAEGRQRAIYDKACDLQKDAKTISDFNNVIAEFRKVCGGFDSENRIEQCEKAISDIREKEKREKEEQARHVAATKRKRTTAIVALMAVIAVAAYFVMTKVVIPERQYAAAKQLLEVGKYSDAYTVLKEIAGYKDVDTLLSTTKNLMLAPYKTVGNTVTFGSYEQDNYTSNGKEGIEWVVLDVQGNKSLLISRYALDAQAYNSEDVDITWEKCTLRGWLNRTFLNVAFNAKEKTAILTTSVDNSKSQGYSGHNTDGGNDTEDQIFLLSYAEAWKYFSSDSNRTCKPTTYAKAQGATVYSDNGKTLWWLRSPGDNQNEAVFVNYYGVLGYSYYVNYYWVAVRPAFWLNLESDIF